jgi:N-methylhydantoinase B
MRDIDPITIEVIRNYLLSAAREMNRNLVRTAYSTTIYEVHDFGVGIYDRRCRLLAEAPGLAIFTRGNDYALVKIVEYLGYDNIHPEDIILLNYPFWSAAHTLDVTAVTPIFHANEIVGFTAVKQHWQDLGQKDPGYCTDTTDLYQEGLVIPCLKIHKRGRLNQDLVDIIRFNSRMPEHVLGDMNAKISSCITGRKRVEELVEKFGPETFHLAIEQILDHGERIARARLAKLPKGTWSADDWVDDDGVDKETMVRIKATVTISDDEMLVDFTGSDPETKGPINVPIGMTMGVGALVFKAITTPDLPANEGNFRPLKVVAPPGSLMNAIPPAPTFTLWPALLAVEVITKALAQAGADIVPACSGGDLFSINGVGVHPRTGKLWHEGSNEGVGFGAHTSGDGENVIMHPSEPGCRNNPIEVMETKAPMRVEYYGLRQDSGGPGQHRGGLGARRNIRYLADSTALNMVKKSKTKPWGTAGGHNGENGYAVYWPGTEQEQVTGTNYQPVKAGDRVFNFSGGGGGWGDPYFREPERVLEDVRNEYVSVESAQQLYGVIIDPVTMTIDAAATERLRSRSQSKKK